MPSKTSADRPQAATSARSRSRSSNRSGSRKPQPDAAVGGQPVNAAEPAAPAAPRRRRTEAVSAEPAPTGKSAPAPAAKRPRRRAAAAPADAVVQAVVEPVVETLPAEPDPEAQAPASAPRSRRGTAKPRVREAAVAEVMEDAQEAQEAQAVQEAPPPAEARAPEPEAEPAAEARASRRRGRSRGRGGRGDAPSTDSTVDPVAEPAPPAAPAATIEPPADGATFGRYAIAIPGEESAEVTLRSTVPGTELCTCLDFALSDDATCPHVLALRQHLQADAARAAAWAAGPQAVGSRIGLRHGAAHRLLWLAGTECPPALDALAGQLLGAETLDDQALPRLLRQAREAGHDLQVDEAVWDHLAVQRDARWRVSRLQALLPQGPASEALRDLGPTPLLPLQMEAALFAVCAGRCILADDAVLQPQRQALAAAELLRRHFGVERVLLLAPGEALDRWRRLLPATAVGWSLFSLDRVAGDIELHRQLAPELVIVAEPADGGLWVDADRAAALLRLRSAHAMVLPGEGWLERPAELPLRLAFVDAERTGAYAALLQAHGVRDEAGQLCGLQGLDTLRATLEPVLLMRSRAEVLSQLPERVDRVLPVPLADADRAPHEALCETLRATLARWQAVGWLPDRAQRQLVDQVQAVRRWCAGDDGSAAVAAAKAAAVQQVLAGGDEPVAKLVVFSQWPGALQALQGLLAEAGVGARSWLATQPEAARQAAVQSFKTDPAVRVLLVADAGSAALELAMPGAQVLHLDRPWNPRLLTRRFGRVHRRGKAHLVPVTQLLIEGSFEHRLQQRLADRPEPVPDLLDAAAAEGFVQGDDLTQWLADLAALVDQPAVA